MPTHEAEGIVTAAGVTSWRELVLHVIHQFCEPDVARRIAQVHLLSGHEHGQLPFAAMNRPCGTRDGVIAACQEWIAQN